MRRSRLDGQTVKRRSTASACNVSREMYLNLIRMRTLYLHHLCTIFWNRTLYIFNFRLITTQQISFWTIFSCNSPFSTFKGKERSWTCKHGFTSSTSATNLPNHLLHDDDHVGWGWFKCVQLVVVNNVSSIEILSLNLTTNYLYDRNVTPPV